METQLNCFETENKTNIWKIFVDGASRGNPGQSGAGVYIQHNDKDFIKKGFSLGIKTNNQAEYLALALALFYLKEEQPKKPVIYVVSDSELLIKQLSGLYKIKNKILQNIKKLIDYLLTNTKCYFKHVLRDQNKTADSLANEGIDKKNGLPQEFKNLLKEYNIEN